LPVRVLSSLPRDDSYGPERLARRSWWVRKTWNGEGEWEARSRSRPARRAASDADTAALLDRGCATQQASLTALQSAGAGSPRESYTRSASLFDRAEHRLTGAGGNAAKGHLAFRDLRLIDGALAELAGAMSMGITGYDIGPGGAPASSAGTLDQPPGPLSGPSPPGHARLTASGAYISVRT
jgi:hypothetical protein